MAIFGSLSTVRAQAAMSPALTAAIDHVELCLDPGSDEHQRLMELVPGDGHRVELAHGAFALAQCYLTKPGDKARWETHKVYIDVQAVITGDEIMEVADVAELRLAEDLTPEKDLLFYETYADGTRLRARDGFIAVFFPVDGHRPGLAMDRPTAVRKVVVKVPV